MGWVAVAQPAFIAQVVDGNNHGDCKGVGDFDGNLLPDIVIGGQQALTWYAAPGWAPTLISVPGEEFTTDMQVADVDGDGDLDVIVPDGALGELRWYENPLPELPASTPWWPPHAIGDHAAAAHDVEVGDFDRNGRVDVVTRSTDICRIWYQVAPDAWLGVQVSAPIGEGIGVGDIDADGDPDLAFGAVWIECPPDPIGEPWLEHIVASDWVDRAGVRVAHINADGRADIVVSAAESEGRLVWFEGPEDPYQDGWTEHEIDPSVDYVHTFQIADVDSDGALDIVFAEMAQSSRQRIGYYLNNGDGSGWSLEVIDTVGAHNIRVADLGHDGDLDIVGCNWQGPPVTAWLNQENPLACYANCDGSPAPTVLNVNDFICFQARFAGGDPWANCDDSTGTPALNVNDFICFQAWFAAGCR